jgi:hypothetical protein
MITEGFQYFGGTIWFAAYRASVDLSPADQDHVFRPLMIQLRYEARQRINGYRCPKRFGERCVSCCLHFRHRMVPISSVILAAMDCRMPVTPATLRSIIPPVPLDPGAVVDRNRRQVLQYSDVSIPWRPRVLTAHSDIGFCPSPCIPATGTSVPI